MAYLVIVYIAFSVLLIVKNYKSKNSMWFVVMLVGFCFAMVGLAFYTTYINYSCKIENKLFENIDKYIWIANYYLKLDIYQQYRIMNIGTAIYIYGSICFALTSIKYLDRKHYLVLIIIPVLLTIIYDPAILKKIYHAYNIEKIMKVINLIFNIIIKSYLFSSIIIMIYSYISTPKVINKKYKYIIIGIIPINFLFFVLFYGFPNHVIVFRRYEQLFIYSYRYNNILYTTISFLCYFSIILLLYAIFKYNIFELNVRKTQIDFESQVQTANFGLNIFTHSIKNQLVAVKYLAEQLSIVEDVKQKQDLKEQLQKVCDESINRLSALSKSTRKIDLNYEKVNVNEILEEIVLEYEKRYNNIKIEQINECELYLFIDRKQFRSVIENHLLNSVEACSSSESPKIDVVIKERNKYGIIKIIDNGKGISKKDIKKIFRPFYSTKPTMSNWGVGLVFCQKVVDTFGGVINVESQEGVGTTVEIYIPNVRRI